MFKAILIATDGSELAEKALLTAIVLAKHHNAKLTVLTSSDPVMSAGHAGGFGTIDAGSIITQLEQAYAKHAQDVLDHARDIAQAEGLEIETLYLAERRPADAVLEVTQKKAIDTIVMGSHGRRGLQRILLGSQAAEVLARAIVPVLVVK